MAQSSAEPQRLRETTDRMMLHRFICFIGLGLFLGACTPMAVMKETRVRVIEATSRDEQVRNAADRVTDAHRLPAARHREAMELYLMSASEMALVMQRTADHSTALHVYNSALDHLLRTLRIHQLDPSAEPLELGRFMLSYRRDSRPDRNPSDFDLVPVDELAIGAQFFDRPVKRAGLGTPLVAICKKPNLRSPDGFRLRPGLHQGLTAVAHFSGGLCEVELLDPQDIETVTLGKRTLPLAADFNAPYASLMSSESMINLGILRTLNPGRYAQTARIVRLCPYDQDKVPLLLVHGLFDAPASWAPLIRAIRDDPLLRRRYQIWIFSYPAGYPYPYSTALLRAELDKMKAQFPRHPPIVYIGHSMGGVIGRLLLTDSGDTLWNRFFHTSPELSKLPPKDLQLMRDLLIFRHRKEIVRAIFVSSPHRGSKLASGTLAQIGGLLIKAPGALLSQAELLTRVLIGDEAGYHMKRMPCSIDTLSTGNPFVQTVGQLPISRETVVHSIMGNRRTGKPKEQSTDGFVPYWSSHLDEAASECIVATGHRAHRHPRGLREILRLLHLHLGDG